MSKEKYEFTKRYIERKGQKVVIPSVKAEAPTESKPKEEKNESGTKPAEKNHAKEESAVAANEHYVLILLLFSI